MSSKKKADDNAEKTTTSATRGVRRTRGVGGMGIVGKERMRGEGDVTSGGQHLPAPRYVCSSPGACVRSLTSFVTGTVGEKKGELAQIRQGLG